MTVERKAKKAAPAAKAKKSSHKTSLPGTRALESKIARMIRVNHAGEFGAQRIYAGQLAVLQQSPIAPMIRHMARQEDEHLAMFEKLIVSHRVRPTALHPLWNLAGYALGAVTAKLGEKAAMACTVAVEEVIDEHYQQQLDQLDDKTSDLYAIIKKFRDDEIEHKHTGLDHGAEDLPYYQLLRALVRAGSKTAIWLSERI